LNFNASRKILWQPGTSDIEEANITHYMQWLYSEKNLSFESYSDLWQWSVDDIESFWESLWDYFDIKSHSPYKAVLSNDNMPGAIWFNGATLNYAEHALSRRDDHPAIISQSEVDPISTITYKELYQEVAEIAAGLRNMGVKKGDRVACLAPNTPNTLIAFLAASSIGAVWSSCSPEFGSHSVLERFQQIEPTILFASDQYNFGGKQYDKLEQVNEIQKQLPSLKHTIIIPCSDQKPRGTLGHNTLLWNEAKEPATEIIFEPVPFSHPLWVLYSSGTTGLPKPIVQSHGGILLELLKSLTFHNNLKSDDRFFWFTTTGWMMWNYLISGLLINTTILLFDGSPAYPDIKTVWKFAEQSKMTYFGTSASYIQGCIKQGIKPNAEFDLSSLSSLGSTGSPLAPEGFQWIYDYVSPNLLLASVSGGTDICTGLVTSCPLLPVHIGEIQCPALGTKVEAFDANGKAVINEVGELVVTKPIPSMPIYFWNDLDGSRYKESYFEMYPGVWRHGDWIKILPDGSSIIYGRSDSTLNRGGVRTGTSEFYRIVEDLPQVMDSLIVDTGHLGQEGKLILFIVLAEQSELDESLIDKIRKGLRKELSPRHVPDQIYAVPQIPKTLNGKKLEVPVKKILAGVPIGQAINKDAMADPLALEHIEGLFKT